MVTDEEIVDFVQSCGDPKKSLAMDTGKFSKQLDLIYSDFDEYACLQVEWSGLKPNDGIRNVVSEMRRKIDRLYSMSGKLGRERGFPPERIDAIVDGLKWANANWDNLSLDKSNRSFSVDSKPVTLKEHKYTCAFGVFAVSLSLKEDGSIRTPILATPHKPLACNHTGYPHPHVNDSHKICFGANHEAVANLAMIADIPEILEIAGYVLHNYNAGDAYVKVHKILGIPKCFGCGCPTEVRCAICGDARCRACRSTCKLCGKVVCRSRCTSRYGDIRVCIDCKKRKVKEDVERQIAEREAIPTTEEQLVADAREAAASTTVSEPLT